MKRRDFIAGLGAAVCPLAARAQQPAVPVIGWLHSETPETHPAVMPLFFKGLAEVGYEEGRNVAIEHRWAEGRQERQPALAADLVARRATVIVVDTIAFAQIAKAATQTIPIVVSGGGGDLIEFGLVASYNHPGSNVTGVVLQVIDISAKRLELLRKLVPTADLIAAFVGGANSPFTRNETRELQSAASVLGARLLILNVVPTYGDVAAAFSAIIEHHAGALLLSASIVFQRVRDQIISLAARHGIPTMFWDSASARSRGSFELWP
jgi:putative tryptophan/tyrosine transport system substrate-binding protein